MKAASGDGSVDQMSIHFDLAIELMRDWRIDRFYIGKAKAFDTATHAANLS